MFSENLQTNLLPQTNIFPGKTSVSDKRLRSKVPDALPSVELTLGRLGRLGSAAVLGVSPLGGLEFQEAQPVVVRKGAGWGLSVFVGGPGPRRKQHVS